MEQAQTGYPRPAPAPLPALSLPASPPAQRLPAPAPQIEQRSGGASPALPAADGTNQTVSAPCAGFASGSFISASPPAQRPPPCAADRAALGRRFAPPLPAADGADPSSIRALRRAVCALSGVSPPAPLLRSAAAPAPQTRAGGGFVCARDGRAANETYPVLSILFLLTNVVWAVIRP